MKQATVASVTARIGSANIRATISLGGSGGGMPSLGGIGSLFAARGLRSGIGIPRFGGIPAVIGAFGKNSARSVGYNRPSASRNHAPEGRSDAGERD